MKTESPNFHKFYRWRLYVLSAISVFLGGVIYILLRPTKAVFLNVFNLVGLDEWADIIREITVPVSGFFPEWFVYTLPNGLWAFAYTLLILSIWRGSKSLLKYFWFATIPGLVFGFEMLQFFDVLNGTFAIEDLLSGLVGIIAGILTTKLYSNETNKV